MGLRHHAVIFSRKTVSEWALLDMEIKIVDPKVEAAFSRFPPIVQKKLLRIRKLIFDVAAETEGVGELEEALKWGQPSYLTQKSKTGSTVRIGREKKTDGDYAIYFKCQTTLVATFKELYPDKFRYEKNRAILFNVKDKIPLRELSHCIAMALTYHLNKKNQKKQRQKKK
jgi:hypothetical protein